MMNNRPATKGGGDRPAADDRPGLAARRAAARLLAAIIDKKTAADGLTDDQHGHPHYLALAAIDRSLVRAILATALRYRCTIAAMINERLDRPLPANAHTLTHILHVALAQVLFLDIPDRAAVDLAVAHAGADPRTRRFTGLVNGVLRAIARRKQTRLPKLLDKTVDAPDWFRDRLAHVYGAERAAAILRAHRRPAPLDLTVKSDAAGWAERLGGTVTPIGSVRLERVAGQISDLPGYEEGAWWVQDAAAALPARLFGPVEGLRVADLCAAPGGKTAQLVLAGAHVTAVDISANRMKRLYQNLQRLGLQADLVTTDIAAFEPDRLFDAVLLDAPCSSTGTVRRHPDVPWTKSPDDIAKLAAVQTRLLGHALRLVAPGGLVVFSNCSLDPEEGEDLVERFLQQHPSAELSPLSGDEIKSIAPYVTARGTLRTTPADMDLGTPERSGMDGFFAARLQRSGN